MAYSTSGRYLLQIFSCLFGITSPQNRTRLRVCERSTLRNAFSFDTTIRADGTQKMVSTCRSLIHSSSRTGWENSFFGTMSSSAPVFMVE